MLSTRLQAIVYANLLEPNSYGSGMQLHWYIGTKIHRSDEVVPFGPLAGKKGRLKASSVLLLTYPF